LPKFWFIPFSRPKTVARFYVTNHCAPNCIATSVVSWRIAIATLIIGGVEDHVHLLSTLSRTCEAAEMVKEVKRGSSLWLKTRSGNLRDFAWQNGYGIFSVGFSQIEGVKNYIAGQEEHHRKVSFQDELRQFLRRYEIEFDERHVWD